MATVFCPNCSDLVEREGQRCTRCGVDLYATFPETDYEAPTPRESRLEFPTGETFADRYTIIERIGAGGMGVVYKAIDTMLDSEVALKLIQPALAQFPGFIERFRREVRVTRQITHPNICRFHDIGDSDGVLYVSMEWIEGETLRQLLEQTGMLREGRALEIAEKIALALEAAHEKGIVHRDLKPANIMLDRRGNVYVLDFGLALERGGEDITEAGVMLGTPAYMSPEQRRLGRLDHRTDLYALGLILREMLIGTRIDPEPGLPAGVRDAVNPLVLPVLERLLEEDPVARCPSAAQARKSLRDALDDPAISTAVTYGKPHKPARPIKRLVVLVGAPLALVAVVAVLWLWQPWQPSPDALDAEAQTHFDLGMHHLSEGPETVAGLQAAIAELNKALDIEPDSARILAGLANTHVQLYRMTGDPIHREEADRAAGKAYLLDPDDPGVLCSRGIVFMGEGKFKAAKRELERSVAARGDFAVAWAHLTLAHLALGDHAAAFDAQERAEELEPNNYSVQVAIGRYHEQFGDWDRATEHYRRATEVRPDSPTAWNNLAAAHLNKGRIREAIPVLERSLDIEDRANTRSNLGTAYYFLERYEDAATHYERAIELQGENAVHHANLGDALLKLKRAQESRDAYGQAADLARQSAVRSPLDSSAQGALALYCAKAGDADCARKAGATAADLRPDDATIALDNAVVRCILGRDAECLDWLDRSVNLGATRSQIELMPELERLADDPAFRKILDRAG